MNQLELVSHSTQQTQDLGKIIGELASAGDIIFLVGNLGAGKTNLTQGLAKGLDITENALSPSFVLAREMYGRLPLYHIDLYRLDLSEEIEELGLEDYFYGSGVTVVEWADKANELLPPENLQIEIAYLDDDTRKLTLSAWGIRYEELLNEIAQRVKDAGFNSH
ncbi:tRNA (adenosine(37)-N6)-threonylcarbamoyltransferase complex ATPase subunit type 1 TsaE [Dehalococcoides mccartyi]|jgi:tRNA threonylcarbamoyladenosine biosynthesis protein TsaE|uniref:tRNA threonylcarbamoyladenosine biosynthesis protein TsaE n=1 Tax=Dehalococcoides mccartyi TaxID=61435 RepID=A0A142V8L1_9CHLR|nr:tRNA (adenosine(37)-N6)-threonylcarbamoyltransferase complex ATPase subunit type 1 TsaE [Dehalococcoides mccartyi]AII60501.1 nucleoid maintenance ATPase YjeE [Dehalococcoides mccartyi CG5]AMU86163.1 P-loop-containing protein [Dehalococcoides mccartyi]AOV99002.1 TsaE [Dehalococcoides mccartyi]MBA2084774.1 tRNA threonylcarbamoyladenosine biosynthesis protein TsaE [Dehalococcoides mccartyi]OBW63009.1 MAG: tRNA (N6-adenosine(37)-N6)-threonylcarbamoyltransferase complex ATPase TsaE [Dehalococcoi